MWEPQVRMLSGRLRMIAFDHRGHGDSPVPTGPYTIADLGQDVIALMDHWESGRPPTAGISIGGMVGHWLAVNHPERIEKLVVIATSAHPGNPDPLARASRDGSGSRHGRDNRRRRRRALVHARLGCRTRSRRSRTPTGTMLAASPVEGYAGCCEAIAAWTCATQLRGSWRRRS